MLGQLIPNLCLNAALEAALTTRPHEAHPEAALRAPGPSRKRQHSAPSGSARLKALRVAHAAERLFL